MATQKEENSSKSRQKSEMHMFPLLESHKHTKLTALTYAQRTLWRPMNSLWALLSWFIGPCSPGILHPLWILPLSSPSSMDCSDLWEEGLDGDSQFRIPLCLIPGCGSLKMLPYIARGSLSYDDWIRYQSSTISLGII